MLSVTLRNGIATRPLSRHVLSWAHASRCASRTPAFHIGSRSLTTESDEPELAKLVNSSEGGFADSGKEASWTDLAKINLTGPDDVGSSAFTSSSHFKRRGRNDQLSGGDEGLKGRSTQLTGHMNSKARKRMKRKRDADAVKELLLEEAKKFGLPSESWKDEWGKDKLVPKTARAESSRKRRVTQTIPPYDRRIEGFIKPATMEPLRDIELTTNTSIACLAHGLDRVLFNPGVHFIQDPRSRVYNFSPYLQRIPEIKNFAFERLTPFVKSSRDDILRGLAKEKGKRFAGSTSSLTGLLSHLYFLISNDRPVDTSTLPEPFNNAPKSFTPGQRMPTAVVFNHRDGVYMIDSDSTDYDDSQMNILVWMGTLLEKFLTLTEDRFKDLLRSMSSGENVEKPPESYRYAESETFVMRSQLDSHDGRLPGTGVFDIKTRAALPLRMDTLNFQENSGYQIKSLHGAMESFDREYYDLIRSAFLKYSFQARIGNMDGVLVAYHNTARLFGFQYIPLEEMDMCLFGAKERGGRIFHKCVSMLEIIAAEIAQCFPEQSVTCLVEKADFSNAMCIWVQPVEEKCSDDGLPEVSPDRPKPIVELNISVDNYMDNTYIDGREAVQADKPWTIHWKISRSSEEAEIIHRRLKAAKARKYRLISYPTGVDADNLEDFLKNLGFGDFNLMPDQSHFIKPSPSILSLRRVAQEGQAELERIEKECPDARHIWRQEPPARADD